MSANILPNKVYTNVKGYDFCFLAFGNNQSLKAVERTNGVEFQGLNGKYYINVTWHTKILCKNIHQLYCLLFTERFWRTGYLVTRRNKKNLIKKQWQWLVHQIQQWKPIFGISYLIQSRCSHWWNTPSGCNASWMLHNHLQCVITRAMAEILTFSNNFISTAMNVSHMVGLKWPHL